MKLNERLRVAQRHSPRQLLWRGAVASLGNVLMCTGLYPLVPVVGVEAARRRAGAAPRVIRARSLAVEWAVAVAVSATRPVGFLGMPVGLRPRRGPRPIVMVHGYAMNRANFLLLGRRLHRAGLGPLYGFEYWSLGKAAVAAAELSQFVDRVCGVTGAREVDIVGHSMGGVIARYFVTLDGGASKVRSLITLGSPHHGSDLSRFGFGHAQSEMSPGSPVMARLDSEAPPAVVMTTIWSRGDALVWASRHARLSWGDEIVFENLGHMGLLASRRVAAAVIERLSAR